MRIGQKLVKLIIQTQKTNPTRVPNLLVSDHLLIIKTWGVMSPPPPIIISVINHTWLIIVGDLVVGIIVKSVVWTITICICRIKMCIKIIGIKINKWKMVQATLAIFKLYRMVKINKTWAWIITTKDPIKNYLIRISIKTG